MLAVTHGDVAVADLKSSLIHSLAEAGLPDAEVTIEAVTDLPRHRETNKLKRFVPLT